MTKTEIPLINLEKANISSRTEMILENITWTVRTGENWLLCGSNGSGKSALIAALNGKITITPTPKLPFSIAIASFEEASRLIKEEREHDDSEFIDGGIDPGRTPSILLGIPNPENHPIVKRCGIVSILNRGLKYLSTGEIRRTLLARTLISNAPVVVLDEPFDGLDTESRETVSHIIAEIASISTQTLILVQDRISGLSPFINRVLYLENHTVSFIGNKEDYLDFVAKQNSTNNEKSLILEQLFNSNEHTSIVSDIKKNRNPLVEMNNVTVAWSGKVVLDNITWKLFPGEHWLIRGPNGSGKTTFLELITGDNPQVFKNDVRLFGSRRGSGETIWEIKARMGIVSWRIHQEYRLTGDIDLEGVLLSGFHDSIGMYQQRTHSECQIANTWLELAQLGERKKERFSSLSYGEQRAILILRAAIKRPPLLILDEPCHGLDSDHRSFVLDLLEKIAATGSSTLLHVTHDPTEKLPCEKNILELRPSETPMWVTLKS